MKLAMMKRLLFLTLLLCSYAFAAAGSYDGKWWHAASKDERTGFLAGYIDCAVYEAGHNQLAGASWNVLEPKVTKYYDTHVSELQIPVESVLVKLGSQERPQKNSGGENYHEKHGIFDGEYWRQSAPAHRLGFIEGYLVCQKAESKPTATFSKGADWYAAQISQWYGVRADDPGEINPKRVDRKIANALYLLKDKTTVSTETKKQ